jgi:DNA (cytosine-5)-methyltransferase 1
MKLYEEIIFLKTFYKGGFVVENVIPYYEPLIQANKRGRHLYWTNFKLPASLNERKAPNMGMKPKLREQNKLKGKDSFGLLCDFHEYDFNKYKGKQDKGKMARNLVDYEAGRTILETYLGIERSKNVNQTTLF